MHSVSLSLPTCRTRCQGGRREEGEGGRGCWGSKHMGIYRAWPGLVGNGEVEDGILLIPGVLISKNTGMGICFRGHKSTR